VAGGIVAARKQRLVATPQLLSRIILALALALAVSLWSGTAVASLATERFESLHDNSDVPPPDAAAWVAQTLPDNEASIRALLRAGFEEDEPGTKVRRFMKVRPAG